MPKIQSKYQRLSFSAYKSYVKLVQKEATDICRIIDEVKNLKINEGNS